MSKGHFVAYQPKKFRQEALDNIKEINSIIEEYESLGFAMSVRQVYYQLVARGKIENQANSYSKLQSLISDGRLAGLISWTAIEDRGRDLMGHQTFASPDKAISWLAKDHYRIDMWANQRFRPEVWVEKAAQEGTVGQICNKLRVDFFACKGYNSQSEQWRAGRRFARYIAKGQTPIVFHLGDHDPSGIDMTRDNRDRLSMFAGVPINLQRIALNSAQVQKYNPPPNPVKFNDSRADDYIKSFGYESWELDALSPTVIRDLIEDAILMVRDSKLWDEALKMETEDKIVLQQFSDDANIGDEDEQG